MKEMEEIKMSDNCEKEKLKKRNCIFPQKNKWFLPNTILLSERKWIQEVKGISGAYFVAP